METPTRGRPAKKSKNNVLDAYLLMNEEIYRTRKDKKIIDLETVQSLASIGATQQEIATVLGCSTAYLSRQADHNPAFALAMERGYTDMKHSLRRAQLSMALNGSAALLIWLGKQHLGQSDKQEVNNNTEINITVQRAMDELRNIPKDQLLESYQLLKQGAIEGKATEIQESQE